MINANTTLIELLSSFYILTDEQRCNEDIVQDYFEKIAEKIFFGGYIQAGLKQIYICDIEFYYHQEGNNPELIKDYAMYHTNDKLSQKTKKSIQVYPYSPIGLFYIHNAGIDIMFESEKKKTRGSILIRGIRIKENNGEYILPELEENYIRDKNNKRCENRLTYIYGELLSSNTIFNMDGLSIKWIDKQTNKAPIKITHRLKVKKYDRNGSLLIKDGKPTYDLERKWRFAYDISYCQKIK